MVTRANGTTAARLRIRLRRPTARDADAFLAAVHASRRLHGRWISAPATRAAFRAYLARFATARRGARHIGFVAARVEDGALVGVLNFSEIVRGPFENAYLGYYAFAPHAGQGYMTEALALALDVAYGALALHRVEVNVQPENARSIELVLRVGFSHEGHSRRYVKIGGRWRDHVRFAMLAEDWPASRRVLLARIGKER